MALKLQRVPYWEETGLPPKDNVVTVGLDENGKVIAALGGPVDSEESLFPIEGFSTEYQRRLEEILATIQ